MFVFIGQIANVSPYTTLADYRFHDLDSGAINVDCSTDPIDNLQWKFAGMCSFRIDWKYFIYILIDLKQIIYRYFAYHYQ